MLPAIIASYLGRMAVGEAAATATGARAAATEAFAETRAANRALPPRVLGQPLSEPEVKAAQAVEKLGRNAMALGEDATKAEAKVKGLQTQTQMMTLAMAQGQHATDGFSGHFVGMLDAMARGVDHLAGPVRDFVALANPAKAQVFDVAMKDAHAVVGRELIPVMDAFTRTARKVGDTMAGFEPVMEPAIRAVAELVDDLGTGLREAAIECEPEIRLLTMSIVALAKEAGWVARNLAPFVSLNTGIAQGIDRALNGENPPNRFDPTRTSRGAAAQEARFVGAKTVADEAIKSALTMGATTEQKQLSHLENIDKNMEDFLRKLNEAGERTKITVTGPGADDEFSKALERANRRTETNWKRNVGG